MDPLSQQFERFRAHGDLLAMGLSSAVPEQAGCRSPPAGGGAVYFDQVPAE